MKQTLEEAAKEYANENCWIPEELHDSEIPDYMEHFAKHFIAGAEWHAKQSPWIIVKESVPKEGEKVFTLTQREGVFYINQETFFRSKYLDNCGKWIHGNSRVIAYMPIPSFDEILEANRDVLERIKEKGD